MHGTSPERLKIARLLAKVMQETGASGAALARPVGLDLRALAPMHVVSAGPSAAFDAGPTGSCVVPVDGADDSARLVLVDVDPERLSRCGTTISFVAGSLAHEPGTHLPEPPTQSSPFVDFLRSYQSVGFRVERQDVAAIATSEMERCLDELPGPARSCGAAVIETLQRPAELTTALLRLGQSLDIRGELEHAVGVLLVGYELALSRADVSAGIELARATGRAYRKLTLWEESERWYELAYGLASHAELPGRAALALDGLGNTYRQKGAVPRARAVYRSAWALASASADQEAIGNVAQNLLRAERELGLLDEATTFALVALRAQPDRELRARLLIEVGTLMVDRGDLLAATDTYRAAKQLTSDVDIRAIALDALLYVRALGGDWAGYDRELPGARSATRSASAYIRVQAGFYRARALVLRGRGTQAHRVLHATERYAAARSIHQYEVQAGELRDRLDTELPPSREMPLPDTVRQELRQLAFA